MTRERAPITEVILGIENGVATAAAVLCCHSQVTTREEWPAVIVGSALSSLATIGGVVYADSTMHSFFLGLAILATYLVNGIAKGDDMKNTLWVAIMLSRALLFVSFVSRLNELSRVIATFSTRIILNPIMIVSICILPLVSFLMGASMLLAQDEMQQVTFPVGVPFLLAVATLLLCGLYSRNRSNKHGNLILHASQQGQSVVTALAFAFTAQYSQVNNQVATVFLPILIGSTVTTLLFLVYASVADVWNAVGSAQFQLISLDTTALLAYVTAPLIVLMSIASKKYGDAVSQTVGGMLQSCISDEFIQQQERPPEQVMTSGLFLLLALATTIGVPCTNMLSPVAAYLMSKAYTSGQPRTERIGLCVHLNNLLCDSKQKMDERINRLANADKKQILNIFVTADELRLFPDMICKLQSAGHVIGICSSTVEGIVEAYDAFVELCKTGPQWYHVGTTSAGRSPDFLKRAADLDLKVAFWSTHVGVTSREVLLNQQLPNLRYDVATTGGGSFIYLTDDWDDSDAVMEAIETIVQDLSAEYSFDALSNVAKDGSAMTL